MKQYNRSSKIGNQHRHLHTKALRPPVKKCVVDGESCVRVPLTQGHWVIVSQKGFLKIKDDNWLFKGGYAGRSRRSEGSKRPQTVFMHRVLIDVPEGFEVDHRNQNKLDNRESNLRAVTRTANIINRSVRRNNTSGCTGVSWHIRFKKWAVHISVDGKPKQLGMYDSLRTAIRVRTSAEKQYYGDFRPQV